MSRPSRTPPLRGAAGAGPRPLDPPAGAARLALDRRRGRRGVRRARGRRRARPGLRALRRGRAVARAGRRLHRRATDVAFGPWAGPTSVGLIPRSDPAMARAHRPPIPSSSSPTPAPRWAASRARSAGASATELGAAAVKARRRAGRASRRERVDQIVMGCVLPAGPRPGAGAAGGAGRGPAACRCEATTVNKMCGSGMQAAILAHDTLAAGSADIVVAGGMESMTNAPYLLAKHRGGARIGHDRVIDSMYLDGLEDAYEPRQADGRLRRGDGRRLPDQPRRDGRLRDREPGAAPGARSRAALSRARSPRSRSPAAAGRHRSPTTSSR